MPFTAIGEAAGEYAGFDLGHVLLGVGAVSVRQPVAMLKSP